MNRETVAHLIGYSTLSLILGTAGWSTFGWVFALPLVLGTLALVGALGAQTVLEKAKVDVDIEPASSERATATDGGQARDRSPREVADAVREHGGENVRDDTIVAALENRAETAGGDRNRRHTN
ncbi:hypothetical protein [Halorussus amylolyticus]|uniref:hypothetical protein n=1 Tax=Halorussus amylolyticus TaxID=1126242 RepID=UPI00104ECA88|nr:hypothetical protein [Halorussus amylolyticus]